MGKRIGIPAAHRVEADRLVQSTATLATQEMAKARQSGAEIVTLCDPGYPAGLLDLDLPPPVLYIHGRIPQSPAIAVVGSRNATPPGLEAAGLFGRGLAAHGLTIVSGFARGIDLAAHRGALAAARGRTVAILGCGLDIDYPRGRRRLRRQLPEHGALVSEFPFGAHPRAMNFPIRNRIIAALSLGVLVVEGTPKSGSLITARLALDLGRDVYAIPGSIFTQRAAGPNALIQEGALLVRHPDEIVESLPVAIREVLTPPSLAAAARVDGPAGDLLRLMPAGKQYTVEQLATAAGTPLDQTLAHLLELEMQGLVKRFPGAVFCHRP